jgi:hypothetical protein
MPRLLGLHAASQAPRDSSEHPPILDRDLFETVQRKLAEQHNGYHAGRRSSEAVLMGLIFDDRANRMSPSHSRKEGFGAGTTSHPRSSRDGLGKVD